MRRARTHTWAPGNSPKHKSLQDLSIRVNPKATKRSCIMLVYESMEAYISVYMCAKSSIYRSSHPIPFIEFSPTNSLEDEGKLFVHSNPLEQVHIIYKSVTKLLLAERLILFHLLGAMDGNVITVCDHRNIIMCKIVDQPPGLMR
jgi:hypothetical protein